MYHLKLYILKRKLAGQIIRNIILDKAKMISSVNIRNLKNKK